MKFYHLSDLHIGKRVCGFSMLEDQRFILNQILELARENRPDGIWIAGDLYDKSMPSAEAVELADWFLSGFSKMKIPVWVISGNHDCAERIAYGGHMMEQAGIHVSQVFDGSMQSYTVQKQGEKLVCKTEFSEKIAGEGEMTGGSGPAYEKVRIYMLPYVRPAQVRRFYPDENIETTQQAVEVILMHTLLDQEYTNILLMHQFLAGASVCESEENSVGGSDQIDASVVSDFDYVALGHLHGPQKVGRETVRYCGSPLKYSFSEANHHKSVTVVEIEVPELPLEQVQRDAKGERPRIQVSALPLFPLRDLREIRGPIDQLLSPEVYETANREDYLHVTLTDEKEILDAIGRLRDVYPNIMRLDFEGGCMGPKEEEQEIYLEEKTPEELFAEFFLRQNGREMDEDQRQIVHRFWDGDSAVENKKRQKQLGEEDD